MKYNDLKSGMVVNGSKHGSLFITGVGVDSRFYNDKPHIKFLDPNDSYHGQALCEVFDDEEFELIEGKERFGILQGIIKQLSESSGSIDDCISLVQVALYGDRKKNDV